MENRYYTPESEEFCIGFEYEKAKVGIFDNSILKPEKWEKDSIKTNTFDRIYMYNELVGNIRVKYLDEQDILDLGFRYTNNNLDLIKITNEKVIRIRLRIIDDMPHLRIYQTDEIFNKEQSSPIFVGKIKNKSELLKLLTQLEVI